jgi:hypothetical protein
MLSLWCSSWISRVGGRGGIWVHEQHEFDVSACDEAVDVIVLKAVNVFEISFSSQIS